MAKKDNKTNNSQQNTIQNKSTQTPLKPKFRCIGRINSSWSTCFTHHVFHAKILVISHDDKIIIGATIMVIKMYISLKIVIIIIWTKKNVFTYPDDLLWRPNHVEK